MRFIPGKLYRLKCVVGFDELNGKNGIYPKNDEILLFLGYIPYPYSPYSNHKHWDVLCFLHSNRKLWRTAAGKHDNDFFEEIIC